jgi:peptidyl-prolyl cis-trans isomerase SurA
LKSPFLKIQFFSGITQGLPSLVILVGLSVVWGSVRIAPAVAQSGPSIAAIVNDEPISQFDIGQRIKLNKVLGQPSGSRQQILEELVEEQLQRQEAKRQRIPVTSKEIDLTIEKMVGQRRSTPEIFDKRLKKSGVNPSSMRQRVKALLAWRRILSRKFGKLVDLDEQDIDRAHQRALKNRQPARRFYMLQQINLPFEGNLNASVVQGRQIEAQRIIENFKGCRSTRRISSGIYNVQIKNVGPIPVKQIQGKLRSLLRKSGPGKLLPPNMTRRGIELLAYCSTKVVEAPEVTREQVRAGLASQQFGIISKRHLRDLKRDAIIDYR